MSESSTSLARQAPAQEAAYMLVRFPRRWADRLPRSVRDYARSSSRRSTAFVVLEVPRVSLPVLRVALQPGWAVSFHDTLDEVDAVVFETWGLRPSHSRAVGSRLAAGEVLDAARSR